MAEPRMSDSAERANVIPPRSRIEGEKRGGRRKHSARPQIAEPKALSIFHEPWWLDLTTGGRWQEAVVERGGAIFGRMPYFVRRQGSLVTSTMPPLTRTLGPAIETRNANAAADFRSRLGIADELIAQLPDFVHFVHVLDPRLEEAIAFRQRGYSVSVGYTFWIEAGRPQEQIWAGMRDKTRNLIRRAGERLTVRRVDEPELFCAAYTSNLGERQLANVYGPDMMLALVTAAMVRDAGCVLGAFDPEGNAEAMAMLVWDNHAVYFLLSTRQQRAHSGAVSLLVWEAIQLAGRKGLVFDFDGFAGENGLSFVTGFGGIVKPRFVVRRTRPWYSALQSVKRRFAA